MRTSHCAKSRSMRTLFERKLSTQDTCDQWFRVWPFDMDAFGHMNNGRYRQIMDVAGWLAGWLLRTGTISALFRQCWKVTLGGNMTQFRRSLRLFAKYRVVSRLVCWDDRWFYLEHTFYNRYGAQLAVGVSRAAFRDANGWVSTKDVMAVVDPGVYSGEMPGFMREWLRIERAMFDYSERQLYQDMESISPSSIY